MNSTAEADEVVQAAIIHVYMKNSYAAQHAIRVTHCSPSWSLLASLPRHLCKVKVLMDTAKEVISDLQQEESGFPEERG